MPAIRYLVNQELLIDFLQLNIHDDSTGNSFLELSQCSLDGGSQSVEPHALLLQHSIHRLIVINGICSQDGFQVE